MVLQPALTPLSELDCGVFAEETKPKCIFHFSDSDEHAPETNLFRQTEQTRKAVWNAIGKWSVGLNSHNLKCVLLLML